MPRPACIRLTVCMSTAAATVALGALLAPAASAEPARGPSLLPSPALHVGNAQSVVPDVPPFGRKLS